jgi:multiple sugar transport system permease protein
LFGGIGMGLRVEQPAHRDRATAISMSFNLMAGYAFAKLRFRGRDASFVSRLPGDSGAGGDAARFLMLRRWADQHLAARSSRGEHLRHLPVRQFARGAPTSCSVARIDGAGELRVFTTEVVPLLKRLVATLAVFSFLASWNDFMWPLIVLTDDSLHTLPVALAGLSREHVQDNELMMAGSVITVLPVLLLFLALQRQYMEGLLAGSVKG